MMVNEITNYLQLYLIQEPEKGKLSKGQKLENRKAMILAKAIRSKRLLQIKNEKFGFRDADQAKSSFLTYFEILIEKIIYEWQLPLLKLIMLPVCFGLMRLKKDLVLVLVKKDDGTNSRLFSKIVS
jgi:hypothetical protein